MEKKDFLDLFDVKFVNLKLGKHNFDFFINNNFIEFYEETNIEKANVAVKLELNRQNDHLFILNFYLAGTIELDCDRCLEVVELPVDSFHKMVLKIVSNKNEEQFDEEIIYVSADEHIINVADILNEFMIMEIPMRTICELANKQCNGKMIQRLTQVNTKDNSSDIDPRWNDLKNLKKI